MTVRVLLLIACVLPVTVLCYQDGAGVQACLTLIPRHDATTANTTTAPYSITVNPTSIKQGMAVTVTLNATDADGYFKGFLVQARCTNCTTADTAIVPGTFAKYNASDDTIKTMECTGADKNSMTHTSRSMKTSAVFTWTAPSNFDVSQGVRFRAVIVKDKPIWWTNVVSQEISITGSNSAPHVAPMLAVLMAFSILGAFLLA
ncbi:putative defense protein 3 [Haliotis asinina]|uniref:putative defense protein 3 n=1 Tax=Haliotis asinina TaxID=109174 RepID=UPI003531DEC1